MKTPVGLSVFGLQDCAARLGQSCHRQGFYPASAVLPSNPFGRILTGDEAYKERTHIGLSWPPEAQVKGGEPIRRSPIFSVWRALVEAGDRVARWNVGQGVFFSLSRILATQIHGLMQTNAEILDNSFPVVAIPDHLDEFGQELLLRELAALGYSESMLIWRPVSAALAWLNEVEGDLTNMGSNDHIHCIYLGPDAIEFTTFRLRDREHGNQNYVLPLRDRPGGLLPINGMDWAGNLIEKAFPGIDDCAFWHAFIKFPEIWQCIAGREWQMAELPRVWNYKGEWRFWNPEPDLQNLASNINASPNSALRRIVGGSCDLISSWDTRSRIEEVLFGKVQSMAAMYPGGRLRGMLLYGPLAPKSIPAWLAGGMEGLKARGLRIDGDLTKPEAGRLWLPSECNEPVSIGAAIYGERRINNIPSYLDTMPQLSILAQDRGRFTWVPLIDAQEVAGGDEHKQKIDRQFQLSAGKRNLHVYLLKGPVKEAPSNFQEESHTENLSVPELRRCNARLVREIVKRLGSVKAVEKNVFFRMDTPEAKYGRSFAELLFNEKTAETPKREKAPTLESKLAYLRRAVFDFPSPPDLDTLLDIELRIRPASGLARIELLPVDNAFLHGDRVLLNYSNMKVADTLPKRMRGWPRVDEIVTDPEDRSLITKEWWVNGFERTQCTDQNYIQHLESLKGNVIAGKSKIIAAGFVMYFGSIDEHGRACTEAGNQIIERIARKIGSDYAKLSHNPNSIIVQKKLSKIISRAGWLYSAIPDSVLQDIRTILRRGHQSWGWRSAIEAGSRAFSDYDDFRLLFQSISKLAQSDKSDPKTFPIHAARSICRVLMLREDAERALDREMAQLFATRALQRLLIEQRKGTFKVLYFQLIQLLLYLLRHRRSDPLCFDPDVLTSIEAFECAKKSMEFAEKTFPNASPKAGKIQKIIDGFDKYLHYEGTEDVISVLRELADDQNEDSENGDNP